jgi:DNA-binding GntR family transcriptional regulator
MSIATGQPTLKQPISGRPLRDDVREYLRDAILHGDLEPGAQIVETRLAREFGISQGPVREALRELEQIGLVEHRARRGTFVRQITRAGAWEVYSLRAHLEVMAVRLAVSRLTEDDLALLERMIDEMVEAGRLGDRKLLTWCDVRFHEHLCECAGHDLLLRTWRGVNPLSWTLFTLTVLRERDLIEIAERHRPILEALRSRDTALVEQAISDHILQLGSEVGHGLPG